MQQLTELQGAVSEMKSTFTEAMQQLSCSGTTCDSVSEQLQRLQLDMQKMHETIGTMSSDQERTEQRVREMAEDRDLLLQQLISNGNVTAATRPHLSKSHNHGSRSSSGCHSNDSGVVMVTAETTGAAASAVDGSSGTRWSSDQESGSGSEHAPSHCSKQLCTALEDTVGYESDYSLGEETRRCESGAPDTCNGAENGEIDVSDIDNDTVVEQQSSERARLRVVTELLDTERSYCRTMWTVQDVFIYPLKVDSILNNAQLRMVFGEELSLLHEKHCRLMNAVQERINSWQWRPRIADLLLTFLCREESEVLQLYSCYIQRFPDTLRALHQLRHSSPPLASFLQCRTEHPGCGGLELSALLLAPVQRLPRYLLLLKQLLVHTPAGHVDRDQLIAVITLLTEFLSQLDDSCAQPARGSVCSWRGHKHSQQRLKKRYRPASIERNSVKSHVRSPSTTLCCHCVPSAPTNVPSSTPHRSYSVLQQQSSASLISGEAAGRVSSCSCHQLQQLLWPTADWRSLPHIRQRRRARLSAAQSEQCLRVAPSSDDQWQPVKSQLVKSPPEGANCRCDVTAVAAASAMRCLRLPITATLSTTTNATTTTAEQMTDTSESVCRSVMSRGLSMSAIYTASTDLHNKTDRRKLVHVLKNVFTLRKRRSKSGMLVINNASKTCSDHQKQHCALYTPLPNDFNRGDIYIHDTTQSDFNRSDNYTHDKLTECNISINNA